MSTLEYTVSMLEAMPEERLKEVQSYIQYIMFRDAGSGLAEMYTEDAIVEQLAESVKKSDAGAITPADVVSQRMNPQAADSLMRDFDDMVGILELQAEKFGYCRSERLREMGFHKIHLRKHRYLLVCLL